MGKEFRFFIYLIERFAEHRGESAAETYSHLEQAGLLDYAENMYELYHVEALDNAFADLDHRLDTAERPAV